jgi:hypothetical protein
MESDDVRQGPDDPSATLAVADEARTRLAASLRLPTGLHPALAAAVAVQVATAAYGVADHAAVGLAVALVGVTIFLGVAAVILQRFRRINGVRVDGLASQIVLGAGTTATVCYMVAFGAATWAAFEERWWLVGSSALVGGVGYAFGAFRWWQAYRHDPAAHVGGVSPRTLAALAVVVCVGLVALLAVG